MPYTKIVQFGDTTEVYTYENTIKMRFPDHLKAVRLANRTPNSPKPPIFGVQAKKRQKRRQYRKRVGAYVRSKDSINRSRKNFFRLCHHNNCLADSIHFLTLTFSYDVTYPQASRHVKRFMERLQKLQSERLFSYISVPELTEENRYHFHLLVYNLSPRLAGYPTGSYTRTGGEITTERATRNLQMQFERGYVDVVLAHDASHKIAGYMGKYMAKALADQRYVTVRGYNSSRNIEKVRSSGSNTLDEFSGLILPDESTLVEKIVRVYDVPYLGKCIYQRLINKK